MNLQTWLERQFMAKLPDSIMCTRDGYVRRKPHPRIRPLGRPVDLGRVEKLVNGWHAWPIRSTTQYGPFATRAEAIDALLCH